MSQGTINDPKWSKLLDPNNFLAGLTVEEFVQELCKDDSIDEAKIEKQSELENPPPQNVGLNFISSSLIAENLNKSYDSEEYDVPIPAEKTVDEDLFSKERDTIIKRLDTSSQIKTFESLLKKLNSLNDQSANKKNVLFQQITLQELNHAENVIQLSTKLKDAFSTYDDLDSKLSSVIQVISPIGEKLENSIRKKKLYIKSIDLINQYHYFYSTERVSNELENLRLSQDWKKKLQSVILVKNLIILSKKMQVDTIPKTFKITELIENYSGLMEKDLLEEFNNAYRENNFSKLNEIALILDQLNGGVNVIQSFINQHSFFIDAERIALDGDNRVLLNEQFKENLINMDYHGVLYEENISQVLSTIEEVVKHESKIVKKVFEDKASHVLQLFLQRIFVQKIENKVDFLISTTLSLSDLAFVRILHGLTSMFNKFVNNLVEFFQVLNFDNKLISTLQSLNSELFSKYIFDKSFYFDIEKRSLESILIEKTSRFNLKHEAEVHSKTLSRKFNKIFLKNSINLTDNNANENSVSHNNPNLIVNFNDDNLQSTLGKKEETAIDQINNFFRSQLNIDLDLDKSLGMKSSSKNTNLNQQFDGIANHLGTDDDDIDVEFNIKNANSMLKCIVESIARVMELLPNRASEYCFEILELIFIGIINSYIESSLEVAYHKITKIDINQLSLLNLSYLKYISISTDILNLVSVSIKTVFLPLLTNAPDTRKNLIIMANTQTKKCELLINLILEELSQIFQAKFIDSLTKQKKKDFTPNEKDILDVDTVPAIEIVEVVNQLYSQVSVFLRGKNLDNFLAKIGNILYWLLLDHYSRFEVSSIGGIVVTKDIIGIQNAIEEWAPHSVLERFATLRELANLYTVQPDLLDALTKEGHLPELNKDIISKYISNREDFSHENFIDLVKMSFKQRTH